MNVRMYTVAAGLSHLLGGCAAHTAPVTRAAAPIASKAISAATNVCPAGLRVRTNQAIVRASGLPKDVFDAFSAAAGENPVAWQFLATGRISANAIDTGAVVCKKRALEICGTERKCQQIATACEDGADASKEITAAHSTEAFIDLMPDLVEKQ